MRHNKDNNKEKDNKKNNESKILSYEEFQKKLGGLRTASDAEHFVRDLVAPVLQEMLEAEMTEHVGYGKHNIAGNNSGNYNGPTNQHKKFSKMKDYDKMKIYENTT